MPVLYSVFECPYSLRSRITLLYSQILYELRNMKPPLNIENSQSVIPMLELSDGRVLDNSLDIMHWALLQNDPDGWIDYEVDMLEEMQGLIRINDSSFANDVAGYVFWNHKLCRDRDAYRSDCELFLAGLESYLQKTGYLFGDRQSIADIAIFPFVGLFRKAGMEWFREALYPNVWKWLDAQQNSPLYHMAMHKQPIWKQGSKPLVYPAPVSHLPEARASD